MKKSGTKKNTSGRDAITDSIDTKVMTEDFEEKTNQSSGTVNFSSRNVWKSGKASTKKMVLSL